MELVVAGSNPVSHPDPPIRKVEIWCFFTSMGEKLPYFDVAYQFLKSNGKRLAAIEGNQGCNRDCSYCAVPHHYNAGKELTVGETVATVNWLYKQGYRVLSYLGGEPFAPLKTKEGITFAEHTLTVIQHAKSKGMLVNVTSNGDYINRQPELLQNLQEAGLDSLTIYRSCSTCSSASHSSYYPNGNDYTNRRHASCYCGTYG